MLFITYKLHEELIDKKFAFVSPLILSTTYLWFDYSHLATQDIIFSSLVTAGLFSIAKIKSRNDDIYIFFLSLDRFSFYDEDFSSSSSSFITIAIFIFKKELISNKIFLVRITNWFIPF